MTSSEKCVKGLDSPEKQRQPGLYPEILVTLLTNVMKELVSLAEWYLSCIYWVRNRL